MVWFSVISVALFVGLCYYFFKRNQQDQHAISGLILKIVAGFGLGLIYKYHYQGGDTFQYFLEAETIAHYLLDHPAQLFHIYFKTSELSELANQIVFHDQARALLFAKIISFFYLFSGGNYWIISAFLSFVNFICIHFLVTELNRKYVGLKKAASISFYFLPTFVFWTSGLLKESLAIGALAIAVALVIRFTRTQKYTYFPWWFYLFISSAFLWELKYFYAAIAVPLLLAILLFDAIGRWKKVHPAYILLLFLIGILVVSNLHYNLGVSRVLDVIYQNYQLGGGASDSPAIHYYSFDGSPSGFLMNLPLALFSGLFRPTFFDVLNPLQFVVATENFIVFILLIIALWKSKFRISFGNPFVITALVYVVSLAVFLAFATPNFGTLSRYKVGYWPFFVLLVLILYFAKQKRSGSIV